MSFTANYIITNFFEDIETWIFLFQEISCNLMQQNFELNAKKDLPLQYSDISLKFDSTSIYLTKDY